MRERQMLGFRVVGSAQRFVSAFCVVSNLFSCARHHPTADQYRFYRARAFDAWSRQKTVNSVKLRLIPVAVTKRCQRHVIGQGRTDDTAANDDDLTHRHPSRLELREHNTTAVLVYALTFNRAA